MSAILNTVLLDAVIKPSIVLTLTLGIARLLRRQSASLRHLVLTAGLASALALPFLGMIVPAWQPHVAGLAMDTTAGTALPFVPTSNIAASAGVPAAVPAAPLRVGPERAMLAIWILGALVVGLLLLVEIIKLARVAFRSETVSRQSWRDLALEVSHQLRLRRIVRLIRNPHASVLGTWGALRPRVLLPRESAEWSGERMRVVLGHELAHVKRNDWLVQIVAEVARTIYWFNPLFWLACSSLRRESEHACDDSAMRLGSDGPTYAAHVLDVVRSLNHSRGPGSAALAMAGTSNLERRLVAMLNPTLNRRVVTNGALALVVLIAGSLTLPLAAMHSPAPVTRTVEQIPTAPAPSKPANISEPRTETPPFIAQKKAAVVPVESGFSSAFRAYYYALEQTPVAQNTSGSISGLVLDTSGARIPGVEVNAAEASTGKVYRTFTNESGIYNFAALPPSDYSMTISFQGFRTWAYSRITVPSGQGISLNATLSIGSINTTADVATSAVGPICFSVFGTVKADGTPFTQADCPAGPAILPNRVATQSAAPSRPSDDVVYLSPPTGQVLNTQNPIPANGQRTPIRLGGDLRPAKLLTHRTPVYPPAARAGGIEGYVILAGTIARDGTIQSLQVLSSTNSSLTQSTIEAVQQWTYQPTLLNGQPVESMTDVTVNYTFGR